MDLRVVLGSVLPKENPDNFIIDIANKPVGELTAGDFISGDNVIIFSGPPLLSMAVKGITKTQGILSPVGVAVNFNISEMKQYLRWSEFGFRFSRHIPNMISYVASMERIKNRKGDILKSFYKWVENYFKDKATLNFVDAPGSDPENKSLSMSSYAHFNNFSSELFNMPFGLLVIAFDNTYHITDSNYLELCKVTSKSMSVSGSNPLVPENVQILFTSGKPAQGPNGLIIAPKPKTFFFIPKPLDYERKPIEPKFPNKTEDNIIIDDFALV